MTKVAGTGVFDQGMMGIFAKSREDGLIAPYSLTNSLKTRPRFAMYPFSFSASASCSVGSDHYTNSESLLILP
jgi:hypothetical protein